jgi:hypothetical protein
LALVCGLWVRREHFLERARSYADASSMPCSIPPPEDETDAFREWEKDQEHQRQRVEYFNRLRLKYERVARFPFLPVEADPSRGGVSENPRPSPRRARPTVPSSAGMMWG